VTLPVDLTRYPPRARPAPLPGWATHIQVEVRIAGLWRARMSGRSGRDTSSPEMFNDEREGLSPPEEVRCDAFRGDVYYMTSWNVFIIWKASPPPAAPPEEVVTPSKAAETDLSGCHFQVTLSIGSPRSAGFRRSRSGVFAHDSAHACEQAPGPRLRGDSRRPCGLVPHQRHTSARAGTLARFCSAVCAWTTKHAGWTLSTSRRSSAAGDWSETAAFAFSTCSSL
jgi:hypothetical protein